MIDKSVVNQIYLTQGGEELSIPDAPSPYSTSAFKEIKIGNYRQCCLLVSTAICSVNYGSGALAKEVENVMQDEEKVHDFLADFAKNWEDLAQIVLSNDFLLNIRAYAAKLFFLAISPQHFLNPILNPMCSTDFELRKKVRISEKIATHKSALIRLGVVIGLFEAREFNALQFFLKDPHPKVREEAEKSIEDSKIEIS